MSKVRIYQLGAHQWLQFKVHTYVGDYCSPISVGHKKTLDSTLSFNPYEISRLKLVCAKIFFLLEIDVGDCFVLLLLCLN